MAKGVNLTSQEWRDLIFDGKNTEFGAYQLRKKSPRRHGFAILGILILLAIIALAVFGIVKYNNYQREKAEALAKAAEMAELAAAAQVEEVPEEEDEPVIEEQPEERPEEMPEEQVATQQVTQVLITDTPDPDKEVKQLDKVLEDTSQIGNKNQDGTDKIDMIDNSAKDFVAPPKEEPKPEPPVVKKPEPEEIFRAVEQNPVFPGGNPQKWVLQHCIYPENAQANGIEGKVIVQFVVEKDGKVSNVTVVRGVDKELDKAAVQAVSKMPKWTPGKNNGVPVRSYFTIPVVFKIQQ